MHSGRDLFPEGVTSVEPSAVPALRKSDFLLHRAFTDRLCLTSIGEVGWNPDLDELWVAICSCWRILLADCILRTPARANLNEAHTT